MKPSNKNRASRQPAEENDGSNKYAVSDLLLAMISLENNLDEVDARERELVSLYHGGEIGSRDFDRESETIAYKRSYIEGQLQQCRDLLNGSDNIAPSRSRRFAREVFHLGNKSGPDVK